MNTKEMIKWLEDVISSYEDDQEISMSYSTIAAIIESLKGYNTLKEEYDRLRNIINEVDKLLDVASLMLNHPTC